MIIDGRNADAFNENRHDTNFVVAGGKGGYHYNLRCHQSRQSYHQDGTRYSRFLYRKIVAWYLPRRSDWCEERLKTHVYIS